MCEFGTAAILQIPIGSENKYDAHLNSDSLIWIKWPFSISTFQEHRQKTKNKTNQQPNKKLKPLMQIYLSKSKYTFMFSFSG